MSTPPSPQSFVEQAVTTSMADDCVVIVRDRTSANLRWANNTLTTNGMMTGLDVTVISFVRTGAGVATGSMTGSVTTQAGVAALVDAADAAARAAAPAEDANELVRDAVSPDWDDAPVPTGIHVYDAVAPALGEVFRRAAGEDRVLYGFVNHESTTTYLGSTTGLRLRHVQPTGHIGCTAKSADLTRSAWIGAATRDFTDVDPLALDEQLARRLGWAARPGAPPARRDPTQHPPPPGGGPMIDANRYALTRRAWLGGAARGPPGGGPGAGGAPRAGGRGGAGGPGARPAGRYDTILPPTAVADLMIDAYWYAGARTAFEGQSVYSRRGGGTRIGDGVARPGVDLFSDPAYPGLECEPFALAASSGNESSVFDNGLPLERTDWIRDGRLTALLQTRHSATMTGQPVTPAIDNLVLAVDGGSGSIEDLVAGTDRGLLLTCLWYIREVDPQTLLLTGITRDGVYLVEGGEITGAVNNFRFNESPVDLLNRFTHASATVPAFSREWGDDYFSRTAMPALRVPDFNMSSVSQAR